MKIKDDAWSTLMKKAVYGAEDPTGEVSSLMFSSFGEGR